LRYFRQGLTKLEYVNTTLHTVTICSTQIYLLLTLVCISEEIACRQRHIEAFHQTGLDSVSGLARAVFMVEKVVLGRVSLVLRRFSPTSHYSTCAVYTFTNTNILVAGARDFSPAAFTCL